MVKVSSDDLSTCYVYMYAASGDPNMTLFVYDRDGKLVPVGRTTGGSGIMPRNVPMEEPVRKALRAFKIE